MSRLLTEAEDRARGLLTDNRDSLDATVSALLEKETISGEELTAIVDRVKGGAAHEKRPGVKAPSVNAKTRSRV